MSTVLRASTSGPFRHHAALALGAGGLAWIASLAVLMRLPGASLEEPLFMLVAMGLVFPLLAWAFTLRPRALPARPAASALPVLGYLLVFACLVLGWGFSALDAALPQERAQSVAKLAIKLLTMVVLPAWLFLRDERSPRAALGNRRLVLVLAGMGAAFFGFQLVFGRGMANLAALQPSMATMLWAVPACGLWQVLEAGLAEEVLFRRVLQQRLADATGSQVAAIAWASLLFGLAHAPGLYLRGASLLEGVAQPSWGWAIAYSIVIIAPVGIVFGVLWARTRSLWLVVVLHGLVDLLPQLAPFIRLWAPAT